MYVIILINSFFRSSNSRMQENSDKKVLRSLKEELGSISPIGEYEGGSIFEV